MTLTVDIGNTTIAFGVVRRGRVLCVERVDTAARPLIPAVESVLKRLLRRKYLWDAAVLCSVVPKIAVSVARAVRKVRDADVCVVGRDVHVPLRNLYRNPRQVGQDRLVGAYAAATLYGAPVIVVDLGTAITFDAVSSAGAYLGGVIVPGLRLSAESLFLKTALLPKIDIKAPRAVIGRTTEESMLSGLFYGYGSLCRGMIALMTRQLSGGRPVQVVMTGGHTGLMKKFVSPKIRIVDDHLVHKGLALLKNP